MPLNTLRLNHQASSHPNDRIVFIKPLPRSPSDQESYKIADTFLRAIAAQCLPIMKNHYLSVTTLEEHEPNKEFIGRNFNNGEIIQLVLRGKNGGWMPFNMVQMVMMHELAHNMHMNHGKLFWQTRNLFSQGMRELWAKGYTGEGFWGSGRTLDEMGSVMGNNVVRSEEIEGLPLCGGTYRSRRRKRRAGDSKDLTWKEKRDRRIEKKFGKNGLALGEDEDKRLMLEISNKGPVGGKPRVAQSKRGRELRAAAALARFETNKQEVETLKKEEESDTEDYEEVDADAEDATDTNGQKLLDSHGHGMIKVCEDEDTDDTNVKREIEEMETLNHYFPRLQSNNNLDTSTTPSQPHPKSLYDIPEHPRPPSPPSQPSTTNSTSRSRFPAPSKIRIHRLPSNKPSTPLQPDPNLRPDRSPLPPSNSLPINNATTPPTPSSTEVTCPICSLSNPRQNPTCLTCAHVLDRKKDPRHWQCTSKACKDSQYVNAGDVGVCGVCGRRRAG